MVWISHNYPPLIRHDWNTKETNWMLLQVYLQVKEIPLIISILGDQGQNPAE